MRDFIFAAGEPKYQTHLTYTTKALAGGCAGFIPKNIEGKIFLGDAGATFMGFFLAGLAVMDMWAELNPIVAISTPLLILSIPIFDMTYTTISRVRNGSVKTFKEWLEFTGRDHLHHRLMKLGFNNGPTLLFILPFKFHSRPWRSNNQACRPDGRVIFANTNDFNFCFSGYTDAQCSVSQVIDILHERFWPSIAHSA